jgi:hypothetical protein
MPVERRVREHEPRCFIDDGARIHSMLGNAIATNQRTHLMRRHRRRNWTLADRPQKIGNLIDEPMSDLTKLRRR